MSGLRHKDDFTRVYDLDDPRPYFRHLAPADYRMPDVVAAFLRAVAPRLGAARGRSAPLRVLDFACGYGANGALLAHALDMPALYAHYAVDWEPGHGRRHWDADRAAFARRRLPERGFEVGGIDIAGNALAYARHVGFLDRAFREDLVTSPPAADLCAYLAGTDLVIETGAIGPVLHQAFARLLEAAPGDRRPWFLHCPRPDVDWRPLAALWRAHDYVAERCNERRIRYRRPLSRYEHDDVLRLARRHGVAPDTAIAGDYILVDLVLARPRVDAEAAPLAGLAGEAQGLLA